MTNRFLCTIFHFVKGIKPDDQMETSVGTRGSDSLLHSLSSGLWAPRHKFRVSNFFFSFPSFRDTRKYRRLRRCFFIFYNYIKFIGFTSILTRMFAGCFTEDNQRDTTGCKFALRAPATKKRIRYQLRI